jgi:hypothetical protein
VTRGANSGCDNPLRPTLHWDCNAHNFLAGDGRANGGDMIVGGFAEDGVGDGILGDAVG